MYEQSASLPVDLIVFKSTHTRLFAPAPISSFSTKFKLKDCGRLGYYCTCACIYSLRIASTSGFLVGTHIFGVVKCDWVGIK